MKGLYLPVICFHFINSFWLLFWSRYHSCISLALLTLQLPNKLSRVMSQWEFPRPASFCRRPWRSHRGWQEWELEYFLLFAVLHCPLMHAVLLLPLAAPPGLRRTMSLPPAPPTSSGPGPTRPFPILYHRHRPSAVQVGRGEGTFMVHLVHDIYRHWGAGIRGVSSSGGILM